MKNQRREDRLHIALLLVTLAVSVGLATVTMNVIGSLRNLISDSLAWYVGAIMALFLVIIGIVTLVVSSASGTYRADVFTGRQGKGRLALYVPAGMALIFLIMAGWETLYELDLQMMSGNASTYIFCIDNSSSMGDTYMGGSDPEGKRFEVVGTLMEDMDDDKTFAVYSFANITTLDVPLQTVGEGIPDSVSPDNGGGTYMRDALETILYDREIGVWTSEGRTALILITDGMPLDFASIDEVQDLLDRCCDYDITLGIVGFPGADNDLMRSMASYTGGYFINIQEVDQITEAVEKVATHGARTRDLLSERRVRRLDWLYAVIRVVALTCAGALLAFGAAVCYGNSLAFNGIIWYNVVKSFVAALLVEIGRRSESLGGMLTWIALMILGTIICIRREDGEAQQSGLNAYEDIFAQMDSRMGFVDPYQQNR